MPRTFAPGKCHQRDAAGQPSCRRNIEAKRANLCPAHEKIWQAAARIRYEERRKAAIIAEYVASQK